MTEERSSSPVPPETEAVRQGPDHLALSANGASAAPAHAPMASSEGPFRLSGDRPRAVRLSRSAIAVMASAACIGIAAVLVYALQPRVQRTDDSLPVSQGRPGADNITSAPSDYAKVPKLGPPLPGDLGRPILSAQRDGMNAYAPANAEGGFRRSPRRDAAQAARERRQAARDAAIDSKLFAGAAGSSQVSTADRERASQLSDHSDPSPPARDAVPATSAKTANGQQAFLQTDPRTEATSRHRLQRPASPDLLQAGSVISAALITGIRSDLPAQITAQVTENVYDSPTGQILLIPQGARLIGAYDSVMVAGQRRVLLAWDRLILPNGSSIMLDRLIGTDAAGMSGLEDRTNHHWGGLLGAALISTLLGISTELATDGDDRLIEALRYGTQDTINPTGKQLVQRQLAIPPTLTVRPGHPLRVMVTRDLILEPWQGKN